MSSQPAVQPPGMAPVVAPPLARSLTGNNLRIGLTCAESFATPDDGLRVSIDGVNQASIGINSVGYRHPVPTEVGFDVAPGHHQISIDAPGCERETREFDVAQVGPTYITGRLAISDSSLLGPVGAPDGFGFAFAGFLSSRPAVTNATNTSAFGSSTYSLDPSSLDGVMLPMAYPRARAATGTFRYGPP